MQLFLSKILFMNILNQFIYFTMSHFVKKLYFLAIHNYLYTNIRLELCPHNNHFFPRYLSHYLTFNIYKCWSPIQKALVNHFIHKNLKKNNNLISNRAQVPSKESCLICETFNGMFFPFISWHLSRTRKEDGVFLNEMQSVVYGNDFPSRFSSFRFSGMSFLLALRLGLVLQDFWLGYAFYGSFDYREFCHKWRHLRIFVPHYHSILIKWICFDATVFLRVVFKIFYLKKLKKT